MDKPAEKFPSCFPPHFAEKILPQGLPTLKIDVFRVCINGTINKETFSSTFEDIYFGRKPRPRNWERRKEFPGAYSVSCNSSLTGALNPLKCLVAHHPAAFLIRGTACSELGPMQRTVDRDPSYSDESHIDWWLYANADPSPMFQRVENPYDTEEIQKDEEV